MLALLASTASCFVDDTILSPALFGIYPIPLGSVSI